MTMTSVPTVAVPTVGSAVPVPIAAYPPPHLTPYGFLGDIAGAVLPSAGRALGGMFGHQQLGQQLGGYAGQLAQRFSPWEAGPMMAPMAVGPVGVGPQITPYGFLGDIAGAVLPTAGRALGGMFGHQQLGQQLGGYAGQLAQRFSPWEAGPMMAPMAVGPVGVGPQITPYGILGDIAGAVLPTAGRALGGMFGHQQLGQQLGGYAGQLAQRFSPWEAGPVVDPMQAGYAQQVLAQQQALAMHQAQPEIAPYGILGGAIGNFLGAAGGRAIGSYFGNRGLGETIGRTAGSLLGGIIPLGVQPYGVQPFGAQPVGWGVPQYGVI